MASAQEELERTVVTGLRRRVRMVASWKGYLVGLWTGDEGVVGGGVGGRRSLAASQSSSTNYWDDLALRIFLCIRGRFGRMTYLAQVASYAVR